MRAAVISESRNIVVRDVEEAPMTDGHVRLMVSRCGICGSDLHMPEMTERFAAGSIIGHEIAGTVSEVGGGVVGWSVGDRVAAYHSVSCGTCENCLLGHEYMCMKAASLSLGLGAVAGGYAQSVLTPARTLFAIPDHVTDDQAALAEPLAIGMHGVNKARIQPDLATVVLGAGPIGAMTALALRFKGHDNVVVVEPNAKRRVLIEKLGFASVGLDDVDVAVRRALGGVRPQAVIECSGNGRAASLAVELVGYEGRVILQGRPSKPVEVSQVTIMMKEVEVVGAVSCTESEFQEAINHIARGSLPAEELITDTIGLDEVDAMFAQLLDSGNGQLKVLVAPDS